nr:hypothetical protein [Trueperella pyogenes]
MLDPGWEFFLSPAPETSLHVLSNLQKLKSALGFRYCLGVAEILLGRHRWLPVKIWVRALRRNFTRSAMR